MRSGGLSPLARGTRDTEPWRNNGPRFIPAGAGNTSAVSSEIPSLTVYPRWRGEHAAAFKLKRGGLGLSPLARGTHIQKGFQND